MKILGLFALLLLPAVRLSAAGPLFPDLGAVEDFSLTDARGREVSKKDLLGRPWLASFLFTRCQGPCPLLAAQISRLQKDLPGTVRLVTFSVDPEHDTPAVLAEYAQRFKADPARWLFFTGRKNDIYGLMRRSFRVGVEVDKGAAPAEAITHSTLIVLVDSKGRVRRFFHGDDAADLKRIPAETKQLLIAENHPFWLKIPSLNAILNLSSALLLIAGFHFIRSQKLPAHRIAMSLAFLVSLAFLGFYLFYHAQVGSVPFAGQGWVRPLYFTILISHTILAGLVPPLALVLLYRALRGSFEAHKRLARITLPLWLYVSASGVTIYVMLYEMKF